MKRKEEKWPSDYAREVLRETIRQSDEGVEFPAFEQKRPSDYAREILESSL